MRSARLALLEYKDGEKRYIIAPVGLQVGAKIDERPDGSAGNRQLLFRCRAIPVGIADSQYRTDARSRRPDGPHGGRRGDVDVARRGLRADSSAFRRNPQGQRRIATRRSARSATRSTRMWFWARRAARGIAGIAADQPRCGAQPGGPSERRRRTANRSPAAAGSSLTSPWGLLAKGYRTRNKKKYSNRFIVVRRDGRPMKNK